MATIRVPICIDAITNWLIFLVMKENEDLQTVLQTRVNLFT